MRTLYHPSPQAAAVGATGDSKEMILDSEALVLYFPAPKTVTGEDVLELHVHGGSATVKAVLSAIPRTAETGGGGGGGAIRYAEPGEFTRRAFLNDRLDLSQVESLSATLAAETEQQRRAAVRGSSGALGRTYEGWRRQLVAARAEMEALIDFAEDQHLDESPALLARNVTAQVRAILGRIGVHEEAGRRAELLRGGVRVALLGPPNAGKSSLMNRLVGREASIVSGESGTTRDVVEAHLDIRGYLCTFADTAGFRTVAVRTGLGSGLENDNGEVIIMDSEGSRHVEIGAVEQEGIRRARAKALESDVIVVLASIEPSSSSSSSSGGGYQIWYDMETLRLAADCPQRLVVVNKSDAVSGDDLDTLVEEFKSSVLGKINGLEATQPILISCKEAGTAQSGSRNRRSHSRSGVVVDEDPGGIRGVADHLVSTFAAMTSLPVALQDLHGVTERQRQLLAECRAQLEEYLDKVGGGYAVDVRVDVDDPELGSEGRRDVEDEEVMVEDSDEPDITVAAEHLRYAANCLGRITGRGEAGDVEEILGVIFEK